MNGLTSQEVEERRKQGLVNDTNDSTSRTYTDIIVKNVFTPFNIILFIIGAALLILGNVMSALSATGIISVNILISTIQEMRAKRRLDKISLLTRPKVTVIRDGVEVQVDQKEIVKDDLIVIRAGEQALVDGVLDDCRSLEMDESLLTGESSTVRKNPGDKIFSGSYCITGEGYFTVTAFGNESYASQMLSSAKKFTSKKTPLQMETQTITTTLIITAFVLLFISLIKEILLGVSFGDMKDISDVLEIFVICLDIVPVALFLLITLTYMIAAIRMANKGVLLQRFNSVESISHVDTVCMDKTGTITTNNLVFESAEHIVDAVEAETMLRLFSSNTGSKNKTMNALITHYGELEAELLEEIQFSSARKYSAVKVKYEGKVYTLYSGAWNVIREHVSDPGKIDGIISREASKGLRTLVLCTAEDRPLFVNEEPTIPDLKAVSVVSIRDEVRPDCRATIDVFLENGMDLKVISGDDPVTVDALFSLANLPGERRIISGPELEILPESELDEVVLKTNIFGRMKPEHKEKVIEVLKRNGRYVAMIGDGVNDVKSLKSAQVGVALESGAGAARGVSDMILVNDNFSALPKALVEGRRTVSGIRDILKVYLSRNFALAFMFIVIFFGTGNLPMLPIQNLVYAFVAVTIIAFFMTIFAKPDENKELILPDVLRFSIPSAATIGVLGVILYAIVWMITDNGDYTFHIDYLETVASYMGMDVEEFFMTYLVWNNSYPIDDPYTICEVYARNAMVIFAALTGALQLLIVCPRYKFLSANGSTNKRILPLFLVLLICLGFPACYVFVPDFIALVGMILLPKEFFMLVAVMIAIAFVIILVAVKKDLMHGLVSAFERRYLEKLNKEYTKGDVVDIGRSNSEDDQ